VFKVATPRAVESYGQLLNFELKRLNKKKNLSKDERKFKVNAESFLSGVITGAGSSLRVIRNFKETVNYFTQVVAGKRNVAKDVKVAGKSIKQAFKTDPYLTSGSLVGAENTTFI